MHGGLASLPRITDGCSLCDMHLRLLRARPHATDRDFAVQNSAEGLPLHTHTLRQGHPQQPPAGRETAVCGEAMRE